MSKCEHKSEGEYAICNRCTTFESIARDARAVVLARVAFLNSVLLKTPSDEAQVVMQDAVKRLEKSVAFADSANLWE